MTLQKQLELYCIGAVLHCPAKALEVADRYGVSADTFMSPEGMAAWGGIEKLRNNPEVQPEEIGMVSLIYASDWGATGRDGGMQWLGDAASECITVSFAAYHMLSLRREQARRLFDLALQDALAGSAKGDDVFSLAKGVAATLRQLKAIQEMIAPLGEAPSSPTHLPSQIRKDSHAS